jgi:hypothetical protein
MRALLVVLGLALLASTVGAAQDRHGFWFNGGFGYGSMGCDGCSGRFGGLSGGLALGGTISPKFLLGVGTTGYYRSDAGETDQLSTLDARLRFYPSRTGGFFLTAGLGLGAIHAEGFGASATETGAGAVLGLGYDIRVGNSISLTPFWTGVGISTSSTNANYGQLGLGLTIHKFGPKSEASGPTVPPGRYVQPGFRPPTAQDPAAVPTPAAAPPPATPPYASPSQPAPPPQRPAVGYTRLPPGANYVGDTRLKLYYPLECGAQHAIAPAYQAFFQTEEGAMDDGFKRSGDC